MVQTFSVKVVEKDGVSIILPEGYIDGESAAGLETAFNSVKQNGPHKLLFNFSGTKKINSTGMSLILTIVQESMDLGIKVHFSNLSRINHKLFAMIGIDEFGEIFEDEAAALLKFNT